MRALMCCATYNRLHMTKECFDSFLSTTDPDDVQLMVIDNASVDGTREWLEKFEHPGLYAKVFLGENVGTAKALNLGWKLAYENGWHAGKLDNDVVFYDEDWFDKMVNVLEETENIGLVGLKRRDLEERPNNKPGDFYRTWLYALPSGQVIEVSNHVIGTCWLVKHAMLEALGGLVQIGLYGLDDAIYCHRAHLADFMTAFVPDVAIEHIDPGEPKYPEYTRWKIDTATEVIKGGAYREILAEYDSGVRSLYEEFEDAG